MLFQSDPSSHRKFSEDRCQVFRGSELQFRQKTGAKRPPLAALFPRAFHLRPPRTHHCASRRRRQSGPSSPSVRDSPFSCIKAGRKISRRNECIGSQLQRATQLITLAVLATASFLALFGCAHSTPQQVDDAALRAADADSANWITYGRTYSEQRFSHLHQIDEHSVSHLGLAWSYDLGTRRGLEATPLVNDGILYTTSAWSLVYALDARTGRLLWKYDPHVAKDHAKFVCCDVVNRGVAMYKGRLYLGTLDSRLIALDAKTGSLVWQVPTAPQDSPYAITGAPRIAKGRVIIGNAGSEYAVRGYVSAYDAQTGNLDWRTYTVPGDPAKPFESEAMRARRSSPGPANGGRRAAEAARGTRIVYDPETDLVFAGTGNGAPWYDRFRSNGDALYIASIIALHADTGEMAWHYQTTPGDNWDYDATQPLMLASLTIDGQMRRVIMQANKNGFFYVLDRQTGKLISAHPFAKMNWATGIDASGRPIENPVTRKLADATIVQPATEGGHNWHPISYNPATGLVYLAVLDDSTVHAVDPDWTAARQNQTRDQNTGTYRAYNGPVADQWRKMPPSGRLRRVGPGSAAREVARRLARPQGRRHADHRRQSSVSGTRRRQVQRLSRDRWETAVGV